jgi:mono/diheme cytochrome c family protein
MSKVRSVLAIAIVSALALVGAGCGGDDEPSTGGTTQASTPATTTPSDTTASTPSDTTAAAAGDATAGKEVFDTRCQGCHGAGGVNGPSGPTLAGTGLTAERVTAQVTNGGGAMPAGLATGTDLENVVAYVVSLQ